MANEGQNVHMYMTLLTFNSEMYCIIIQLMRFISTTAKQHDGCVTDDVLQLA